MVQLSRRLPATWFHEHAEHHAIPGFATLFWEQGLQAALKPIQVVIIRLTTWKFVRLSSAVLIDVAFAIFAAVTSLAFAAFNVIVWPYFYVPAWCLRWSLRRSLA